MSVLLCVCPESKFSTNELSSSSSSSSSLCQGETTEKEQEEEEERGRVTKRKNNKIKTKNKIMAKNWKTATDPHTGAQYLYDEHTGETMWMDEPSSDQGGYDAISFGTTGSEVAPLQEQNPLFSKGESVGSVVSEKETNAPQIKKTKKKKKKKGKRLYASKKKKKMNQELKFKISLNIMLLMNALLIGIFLGLSVLKNTKHNPIKCPADPHARLVPTRESPPQQDTLEDFRNRYIDQLEEFTTDDGERYDVAQAILTTHPRNLLSYPDPDEGDATGTAHVFVFEHPARASSCNFEELTRAFAVRLDRCVDKDGEEVGSAKWIFSDGYLQLYEYPFNSSCPRSVSPVISKTHLLSGSPGCALFPGTSVASERKLSVISPLDSVGELNRPTLSSNWTVAHAYFKDSSCREFSYRSIEIQLQQSLPQEGQPLDVCMYDKQTGLYEKYLSHTGPGSNRDAKFSVEWIAAQLRKNGYDKDEALERAKFLRTSKSDDIDTFNFALTRALNSGVKGPKGPKGERGAKGGRGRQDFQVLRVKTLPRELSDLAAKRVILRDLQESRAQRVVRGRRDVLVSA